MTLEEALAEMRDIAGLDISMSDVWWDLLLYWGAILGALAIVGLVAWFGWRWVAVHYGPMDWQKRGMLEVEKLRRSTLPPKTQIGLLNGILKRCACAAGLRRTVAQLAGDAWVSWLQGCVKQHYVHHHDLAMLGVLGHGGYAPDHVLSEPLPGPLYDMVEKAIFSFGDSALNKEA